MAKRPVMYNIGPTGLADNDGLLQEEEEEERLLLQNKWALYTIIIQSTVIGLATETPIKTCNMSLAWEPPYNDIIIHINKIYIHVHIQ